jgi:hypothetical protein
MEVLMKAFCILLIALNASVLAASYFRTDTWSYEVCRNAFGLCESPLAVGLALLACAGMFIAVKEMG